MRRRTNWAIVLSEDSLTVCKATRGYVERIDLEAEDDLLTSLSAVMDENGYRGEPVLVAIDSYACLAAEFAHGGRAMLRDKMALKYALEDHLPLSADDIVADFIPSKDTALGIATEREPLEELLDGLRAQGISVSSVVPLSLLLFSEFCQKHQVKTGTIVSRFDNHWESLAVRDGKIKTWRVLGGSLDRLEMELSDVDASDSGRLIVLAASKPDDDAVKDFEFNTLELDKLLSDALQSQARDKLACIDFCNDPEWGAGTKSAAWQNPVVMAMLILGIGVAIGLQVLGHRYEQIVNVDEATQRRLFTEALPNDRVPVGIRSRLESECAKLAGATGAVTELPQTFSALETLQRTLSQLPAEMRIRVNDLRVQEESVVLRGEVRRYGDSDAVAAALRERGFVVEPVQTERLPNEGVGLTVTAQIDESTESRTK